MKEDDGGDSFLWAVTQGDYRDSLILQNILLYVLLPWPLQICVTLDSKNLMAFTNNETCSSTLLRHTITHLSMEEGTHQ